MKATQKLCTAALTSALPLLMESRLPSVTGHLHPFTWQLEIWWNSTTNHPYYASFGSQAVTFAIRTRRWWYNWEGLVTANEAWQSWYLDAPCKLSILFIFLAILRSVPSPHRLGWKLIIHPQKHFNAMHTSHADSQVSAKVRFSVTLAG